ncbi:hypothetical protein B0H63DRAFT_558319 [Podospora didyma]|uniref:Prion-inhibition and propagation HeLo domain-containing protein n=1 Tax=Podospora didyma TaxID=330526 RepID=A0AAE0NSF3_9PEZI|nr:hypothetical protein B0H63DRAFT_558319 [Podospora didyma]
MEYAVAGIRLLSPLFQACQKIYTTIQDSKTFGERFQREKRWLDAEYAVFVDLGERERDHLAQPIDEHDTREGSRVLAIHGLLENARDIMESCEKLIQEVEQKSKELKKLQKPRPVTATTSSPSQTAVPADESTRPSLQLPDSELQSDRWTTESMDMTDATPSGTATPLQMETSLNTSISELSGPSKASSPAPAEADTKTKQKLSKDKGKKKEKKTTGFRSSVSSFFHGKKKQQDGAGKEAEVLVPQPEPAPEPEPVAGPSNAASSPPPSQAPPRPLAAEVRKTLDRDLVVSVTGPDGAVVTTPAPPSPPTIHPERGRMDELIEEIKGSADKLKGYHNDFTMNNKKLKKLLELKDGKGLAHPTPEAVEQTTALIKKVAPTQDSLKRLHQAIRSNNPMDAPKRVTLRLVADFEKAVEAARVELDYLPLRTEGEYFYFGLRIHDRSPDNPNSPEASEYVVETRMTYDKNDKNDKQSPIAPQNHKALELKRSSASTSAALKPQPATTGGKFELWGDAVYLQSDYARDLHRLFRNKDQVWKTVQTLQSFMQPDGYGGGAPTQMKLWQRVELMKLAVAAQLHLANLRPICRPLTLGRFVYYTTTTTPVPHASWWGADAPLVLKPFLDIGFGQRNEGLSEYPLNYIVELGIVLFQIAGCVAIGINTGDKQKEAMDWADEQFDRLNAEALVPLAQVARDCVRFAGEDDRTKEGEFLANKFLRLEELWRTKYNRSSAAGRIVPPRGGAAVVVRPLKV